MNWIEGKKVLLKWTSEVIATLNFTVGEGKGQHPFLVFHSQKGLTQWKSMWNQTRRVGLRMYCREIKWGVVKCSWILKPMYVCFQWKVLKYVIIECKHFVNCKSTGGSPQQEVTCLLVPPRQGPRFRCGTDSAGGALPRPGTLSARAPQIPRRTPSISAVLQPKKKASLWSKTASRMDPWEKSAKLPGISRKTGHKRPRPAVCDDCPTGRYFSSSPGWRGLPRRPPATTWVGALRLRGRLSGGQGANGFSDSSTSGSSEPWEVVIAVLVPAVQRPVGRFSVLYSVGLASQREVCHESSPRHTCGRPSAGFRGQFSVSG